MAYGNYAPFYRTGYFNPMQTAPLPNMQMPDNSNQFNPNYQPPMQQAPIQPNTQPILTPTAQTPQMSNDMIWVQGLAGAKAYLVAPNTTVTLWDSEGETIYLKSCDSNGMPSMKILDIKERVENTPKSPSKEFESESKDFARLDDLKGIEKEFSKKYGELEEMYQVLKEKVDKFSIKPTPKVTKKVDDRE